MARTFTTSFRFNGESYIAVVTHLNGLVSVYLPDENLHAFLPQGRFTYNPLQGKVVNPTGLSALQRLQFAVMAAVELCHPPSELQVTKGKEQEYR